MTMDDLILVSVDDHIIEPPDLFDGHIARKWADRAPRLIFDRATGKESWTWEAGTSTTTFINAVVTLPKEEWGFDPSTLSEIRPGCYDVGLRVRDMDRNGIFSSLCFPSFPSFSGGFFAKSQDKDLALAVLQAYNDWHIDEWAASHPGRFMPLALPAIWDAELAAQEARRVARKGCTAITFSENPTHLGMPSIHTGYWDPFFRAVAEEGMVLAIHIASDGGGIDFDAEAKAGTPWDVLMTLPTWAAIPTAAHFLWSGLFQRIPGLKVALSEGGTSWIPGFLDRMERHYGNQRWTGSDLRGKTPTEVFQEHFLVCFISDPSGLLLRDRIGIDIISFECDFPHSDCTFPLSPEDAWHCYEQAGCTEEERRKISYENALRFFRTDPFRHVPKSQATVGALRARAKDVDIRTRSRVEYKQLYEAAHAS